MKITWVVGSELMVDGPGRRAAPGGGSVPGWCGAMLRAPGKVRIMGQFRLIKVNQGWSSAELRKESEIGGGAWGLGCPGRLGGLDLLRVMNPRSGEEAGGHSGRAHFSRIKANQG